MRQKRHWYDYLWIVTPIYLGLGMFNILFAWLGMIFLASPCSSPSLVGESCTATASVTGGSSSACWAAGSSSPATGLCHGG